jgi:DNA-binding response OmpR family regulator
MPKTVDVLVVDDDEDLRAFLQVALRYAGYSVICAGDGPEATAALEEYVVGLVILDKQLVTVSGLELLEDWFPRGLEAPVIVVTADQDEHNREEGLARGAAHYLRKPLNLGNLMSVVGSYLGRSIDQQHAEQPDIEMVDFGAGPTEARRHVNPDGSLGGWVAATARVDADCTVAKDARVFGNARVFGGALILGHGVVCDLARVRDGGIVTGQGVVSGSADVEGGLVCGEAIVTGDAFVGVTATVKDLARVTDSARVSRGATVGGTAVVRGNEWVSDGARIR